MKENILILLEMIGSGGVETAVLNKAIAYKKKGHNVFVAAKRGIYVETLEKNKIKFIEFEHELSNDVKLDRLEQMNKIIVDNKITQVHIHQFPCLIYGGLAAINNSIPYMVYLHSEKIEVFQWFINCFAAQKELLKKLVSNAAKIVSITRKAKETSMEFFNLSEDKYVLEKNSLDFENYVSKRAVKEIKNYLIVSRLAKEKWDSVKNGIDLFLACADEVGSGVSLKIVGDGNIREDLEKYVEENNVNKYDIEFCGQSNNVSKYLEDCDLVIGIGRCLLEGIAMKRIVVLSAVDELKDVIVPKNVDDAIDSNFNGRASYDDKGKKIPDWKSHDIEYLVKKITKLSTKDIKEIVDDNYKAIYKRLNIMDNSYVYDGNTPDYKDVKLYLFNYLNKYIEEKTTGEIATLKASVESLAIELAEKNSELEAIKNSRVWKLRTKIVKLFGKR